VDNKLAIASDNAGFELKENIVTFLRAKGVEL
jgi:ribose 5-phosphate isomerase RpiB